MSAAVTYTTFGNTIVHERRNGVDHDYMRDPLGSTVGLLDSSQVITDTFSYWPYGEIQSQTGSTGTPFTFCGTLGYFLDQATQMLYVRARSFIAALSRWLTVDPLWPDEPAYCYGGSRPSATQDASGKRPRKCRLSLGAIVRCPTTCPLNAVPCWLCGFLPTTAQVPCYRICEGGTTGTGAGKHPNCPWDPCSGAKSASLATCCIGFMTFCLALDKLTGAACSALAIKWCESNNSYGPHPYWRGCQESRGVDCYDCCTVACGGLPPSANGICVTACLSYCQGGEDSGDS